MSAPGGKRTGCFREVGGDSRQGAATVSPGNDGLSGKSVVERALRFCHYRSLVTASARQGTPSATSALMAGATQARTSVGSLILDAQARAMLQTSASSLRSPLRRLKTQRLVPSLGSYSVTTLIRSKRFMRRAVTTTSSEATLTAADWIAKSAARSITAEFPAFSPGVSRDCRFRGSDPKTTAGGCSAPISPRQPIDYQGERQPKRWG